MGESEERRGSEGGKEGSPAGGGEKEAAGAKTRQLSFWAQDEKDAFLATYKVRPPFIHFRFFNHAVL